MLIAIMSTTYEKVRESTYEYWQLERAKVLKQMQEQLNDNDYKSKYYTPFLYSLEGDEPIVGVRTLKFTDPSQSTPEQHQQQQQNQKNPRQGGSEMEEGDQNAVDYAPGADMGV